MDKIRIWFKGMVDSDYYENVWDWHFTDEFFVFNYPYGEMRVAIDTIKQVLIADMGVDNEI